MTPKEIKRIKKIISFWEDQAEFIEKRSRKLFRNSGAYDNGGDEGWSQALQLSGKVEGLREAARDLKYFLDDIKDEQRRINAEISKLGKP